MRVEDPHRWLEDANSAEVQAWTLAQDNFARERLRALPLTDTLLQCFTEPYYLDWMSAPFRRAGSR